MIFIAWIVLGTVLALGAFFTVYAGYVLKKESRRLQENLKHHLNDAFGIQVRQPGVGWVPANARYRGGR